MSLKEEVFSELMQQVLKFIDKFKFIDKSVETLCKKLSKSSITSGEFTEVMKLYNTTGNMFTKSLELLDSIICRFPQELTPGELELLEYYRKLPDAKQYIYKMKIKEDINDYV